MPFNKELKPNPNNKTSHLEFNIFSKIKLNILNSELFT